MRRANELMPSKLQRLDNPVVPTCAGISKQSISPSCGFYRRQDLPSPFSLNQNQMNAGMPARSLSREGPQGKAIQEANLEGEEGAH